MNKNLLIPVKIGGLQLQKWIKKPEVYLTFLCLLIFMLSRIMPIRIMIEATQISATPYVFPFLFSDSYMAFFILVGNVILFVDAPFWNDDQSSVLVRVGRNKWLIGQIIYIGVASFIYLICILVISVCVLLPDIQMSLEWGSIWNTIAQSDAVMTFNMNMGISYYIISRYDPLEAIMLQFFMSYLVSVFIGLFMFLLNMNIGRRQGISLIAIMILVAIRMRNFPEWVIWFFPVSWSNLAMMRQEAVSMAPTLYEGAVTIMVLNSILIFLILITEKRKDLL